MLTAELILEAKSLAKELIGLFPDEPIPVLPKDGVDLDVIRFDKRYGGRKWTELRGSTIIGYAEALLYMTAKDAAYYLPFIMHELMNTIEDSAQTDCQQVMLLSALGYMSDPSTVLSPPQLDAIYRVLRLQSIAEVADGIDLELVVETYRHTYRHLGAGEEWTNMAWLTQ